jgi:hypothetical protein
MDDREFELRKLFYLESMRMMSEFSAKGVNALFLASGGAATAILTLIGHRLTNEAAVFFIPLAAFFLSAVLASVTFCLSYIAQFFYAGKAFSGKISIIGTLAHLLAVLSMLSAYGACFYGMWRVYLIFMRI